MEYKNPKIEEGINYSRENPLKEFILLVLGLLAVTALIIGVLHQSAGYLAKYIPFQYEQTMLQRLPEVFDAENATALERQKQRYLQGLADRLSPSMDLPEGMHITVHYLKEDVVNAFATLGGHVYFFQGLLDQLSSEDALAMVMAHEIAHVKHRHPIVALGKGVTIATLGSVVAGVSGSSAGELLIGHASNLSVLKFSRDQESMSDKTALAALVASYGHGGGAKELFDVFAAIEAEVASQDIELLRSHPFSEDRWEQLKTHLVSEGAALSGARTPLPDFLKTQNP